MPLDSDENSLAAQSPLGKASTAVEGYTPSLLCPLPRDGTRRELGLTDEGLPFTGVDTWNLYELSWLDGNGKPQVALGQLVVPCESPALIESKSLKLYLNSFNQSRFDSAREVARTIEADLTSVLGAAVAVTLQPLSQPGAFALQGLEGQSLDELQLDVDRYTPAPHLLAVSDGPVIEERLYTNLFRSCCPVTGQPDWASVSVAYRGQPLEREGLLRYLVSFRAHQGFHEQCVERIFVDIQSLCKPESLSVDARFLRRGGIDINPFRTNGGGSPQNLRLLRQ